MLISTSLWILLIVVIALLFAVLQYSVGFKKRDKFSLLYAGLRFLSIFGLLLLLLNPKWTQVSYYNEKPTLAIAVDNSRSIEHLGYDSLVRNGVTRFRESKQLQEKFDVQFFKFGRDLEMLDTLSFKEKQTNLANVFTSIGSLYKKRAAPTILITDGNQTYGRDFKYAARDFEHSIYPVAVGDTAEYRDIRIEQINVNRYAYIKNKFPVEVFLKYSGTAMEQSSLLEIKSGNKSIHKERIRFSLENKALIKSIVLPADKVGLARYNVTLTPLQDEKNIDNNSRNFAIEVIDQKTNVLLVSNLVHPDIGMFKKSIESNDLRNVTISNTTESTGKLSEFQLVILYQPDEQFGPLFKELRELSKNTIIVTGPRTNWGYLNNIQSTIQREVTGQTEEVQAILNPNFSSFTISDIGFSNFPPLLGSFGEINFMSEVDIALFQKIGTIATSQPLIAASDIDGQRSITIFGSGLWKWRAQSYRDRGSFKEFDNFIDKLVQYAASNKRKNRLDISYDSFYYGTSDIRISAQYFDKNYVFDNRGSLSATVINKESKEVYKAPLLLKSNYYELDLSNLNAGDYEFSVNVLDQKLTRSGSFTIIPFEAEIQFLNANMNDLNELAAKNEGALFTIENVTDLIKNLVQDDRYRSVQKSSEKVVPLIDRKWLLALIILFLTIEWFMRKYRGLT